ncbi:GNAT family N-acetyltransferase [Bradyrhizobium sp. TZ2]
MGFRVNSLCARSKVQTRSAFIAKTEQVGFARIVTDCARLAYLMDVFIDRNYRGRGIGAWLAAAVRVHPDLTTVSRWLLATKDAHGVYERAGWSAVRHPDWMVEVLQHSVPGDGPCATAVVRT